MLCTTSLGLISSCSKDDAAAIIGEWECTYAEVESIHYYDYGNWYERIDYYEDTGAVGKIWKFRKDGYLLRDGMKRLRYSVNGNELNFAADDGSIYGLFNIYELKDEFMTLELTFDNQPPSGRSDYIMDIKETYEFRKL